LFDSPAAELYALCIHINSPVDRYQRFRPEQRHDLGAPPSSRMHAFHAPRTSSEALASAFAALGFAPVEDVDAAFRELRRDGFIADYPRNRRAGLTLMSGPNDATVVLFRDCDPTWLRAGASAVDIIVFGKAVGSTRDLRLVASLTEIEETSTLHSANRAWILEQLTGLSTNGRLLTNAATQDACRRCYADAVREECRGGAIATASMKSALRQGLWLEHLVADMCLQFTQDVWVGVMADLFELDVLANVDGQSVLFECKDTNLGQNDFLIALKKAHEVEASVLVLLSTKPFHANVIRAIENEIARADEDGDPVVIPICYLDAPTTVKAVEALNEFMHDLRWLTLYHWLYFSFTSAAAPTFFDVKPLPADA
jgi:hypothetical protein